jgi:hypothetical protein
MRESEQFVIEEKEKVEAALLQAKKSVKTISWLRLVVFFLICLSLYFSYSYSSYFLAFAALMATVFAVLVVRNQAKKSAIRFHEQLLWSLERDQAILDFSFDKISDGGTDFLNPKHHFTYDLDIFGSFSLFKLLNRATTSEGRGMLAGMLKNDNVEVSTSRKYQQYVQFLASVPLFLLKFEALGRVQKRDWKEKGTILEILPLFILSKKEGLLPVIIGITN